MYSSSWHLVLTLSRGTYLYHLVPAHLFYDLLSSRYAGLQHFLTQSPSLWGQLLEHRTGSNFPAWLLPRVDRIIITRVLLWDLSVIHGWQVSSALSFSCASVSQCWLLRDLQASAELYCEAEGRERKRVRKGAEKGKRKKRKSNHPSTWRTRSNDQSVQYKRTRKCANTWRHDDWQVARHIGWKHEIPVQGKEKGNLWTSSCRLN